MPKKGKKNDTIVISKRSLLLFIFLAVIAVAVGIAVPATIHLKEKHQNGSNNNHSYRIEKQIGEDGVFYAYLFDEMYYDDDDEEPEEEGEETEEAFVNNTDSVTNCAEIYRVDPPYDEEPASNGASSSDSVTNCISLRSIYGEEYDYQGKIIGSVSDFVKVFGRRDRRYDDEFFAKHKLISIVTHMDTCSGDIRRVYIMGAEGRVALPKIEIESACGVCADEMSIYLISVKTDEMNGIDTIAKPEYEEKSVRYCDYGVEKKPVIYLYPTETTDVDVKLGAPEKLTVSYPKYVDSWKVTANPDGSLVDRTTGRNLYSLYYETDYTTSKGVHDEGFVVKGSEAASFLEEKLARLGLNEREAEEFIIYWLPQLEANAYNYIYFAPTAEIAENMPLNVTPAPETVIRINMEFKALDAPIQVKEQQLPETPIRKGFTLVEWGGTIL